MDQFPNGATTAMLEEIAPRVAPLGWHLEINIAKAADWVGLEPRLARCPVPLVFDHLGRPRGGEGVDQPGFKVIRRLLAGRDDCWTKISSFYRLSDSGPPDYADMKPFIEILLGERPDRCVWGTNWPHPGMTKFRPNDADLLDLLESWIPRDALRVPLFAANAARLYRF
jgi:predicted TIM-barrel fold metal-dependent hydrolase